MSTQNTLEDAGRLVGDLAECVDKQVELANKMVPLVEGFQRLAVQLQDQAGTTDADRRRR